MSEEPEVHTADPGAFYLIWTKNGRNPRFSHTTLESAEAEVRRLALRHPDKRWFIVKAIQRVWVNEAPDRVAQPAEIAA